MNTVLLHTCCAPCSVYCVDSLRAEGIEPTALWYNPNIHPYQEYVARRDTLMWYAPSIGMELKVIEEYGLRNFVRAVAEDIDHRCTYCYDHRIEGTARYAAEHGFTAFTSTLLASLYQDHEGICRAAERFAKEYGVEFLYRDFRPNFREGNRQARELG
ncbi:MAG: epoxyqueuosine reductase QueH, partial [Oscillospiraceae bacterium]|nr:epoxyqueuosine reductase QueH [Oscillospiraceae bacterium]